MKKTIFVVMMVPLAFFSCNRKGCLDEEADNYNEKAKVNDNSCEYGYDKFIGSYNVTTGACDYEAKSFVSTIIAGPSSNQIIISNFNDESIEMLAEINGNNITFSKVSEGVGYVGTGYIIDKSVTIDCFLCEDYNYPDDCTDSSCSYSFVRI